MTRFKKIMATVCAGVLLLSLAACGAPAEPEAPAAATVNGVAIPESKVSDYIMMIREQSGFAEDVAWASALKSGGYTPETFRDTILDSMIEEEILKQYAAENGIVVDPAAVDSQVETTKANYPTDEEWQTALSDNGFATEDDYRAIIEANLLRTQLQEQVVPGEPTAAELQTEVDAFKANYSGRRSSHILISSSAGSANEGKTDEELLAIANDLHAQLDEGADFATLAQENSADGSAANGGDVGWDCLSTFVTEYQTALDALAVGEYSTPVQSQFGYHIILCTDEFIPNLEGEQDITLVPSEILDTIKTNLNSTLQTTAWTTFIEDIKAKAEVVRNPMPEDVPYNIDMSLAETPAADTPATDEAATDTPATDDTSGAEDQAATPEAETPAAETPAG